MMKIIAASLIGLILTVARTMKNDKGGMWMYQETITWNEVVRREPTDEERAYYTDIYGSEEIICLKLF